MSTEDTLKNIESEVTSVKEELEICKEARTAGEACEELHHYCTKETEPFDKMVDEPNEWHKSQGGGGCIIL